jgi:DNA polymerase III epsilon subunit-like protein
MKLTNKICVFDLETDGANPNECSPVQIAAVIVDPVKLEIVKDSEFNIMMKPEKMEENPSHEYDNDILNFHAKVRNCQQKDIIELWQNSMSQKQAWGLFTGYLEKYHSRSTRKNEFSAPIASGYNINRFDLKIINRLAIKFKSVTKEENNNIFYPRDVLDLMNLIYYWFMYVDDVKSISLDNMRDYFAISKENAHDALKDVKDCANILIRFLKLHKSLSAKIQFKGAFNGE